MWYPLITESVVKDSTPDTSSDAIAHAAYHEIEITCLTIEVFTDFIIADITCWTKNLLLHINYALHIIHAIRYLILLKFLWLQEWLSILRIRACFSSKTAISINRIPWCIIHVNQILKFNQTRLSKWQSHYLILYPLFQILLIRYSSSFHSNIWQCI